MARQSMVLQILLIVFILTTVVLGVTTYLYVKGEGEQRKTAEAANQSKLQAEQATAEKAKECEEFKKMIGLPEHSLDDVKKQYNDDMAKYGGAKQSDDLATGDKPLFDQNNMYYHLLLDSMFTTIQNRSDELIRAKAEKLQVTDKLNHLEANAAKRFEDYQKNFGTLEQKITTVANDYNTTQVAAAQNEAQAVQTMTRVKTEAAKQTSAAADAVKAASASVQKSNLEFQKVVAKLNSQEKEQMDVPSGEITWASLPTKTVWINRGRADNLHRQTQFLVYAGDSSIGAKAVKKGKVEVTRITGEHEAEAKIIDDQISDPIMAGDKVWTKLWTPGEQNHFALAGIMNLDGDGRNQLNIVRGLINSSGGAIDCEQDELGHKTGEITANTRIIVEGDAYADANSAESKNYNEIINEAARYHVQVVKLSDFKQQMGYEKSSSVEHFGKSGPTPEDAARAAAAQKASKAKTDTGAAAGGP
jgi:hypothetical protein